LPYRHGKSTFTKGKCGDEAEVSIIIVTLKNWKLCEEKVSLRSNVLGLNKLDTLVDNENTLKFIL